MTKKVHSPFQLSFASKINFRLKNFGFLVSVFLLMMKDFGLVHQNHFETNFSNLRFRDTEFSSLGTEYRRDSTSIKFKF